GRARRGSPEPVPGAGAAGGRAGPAARGPPVLPSRTPHRRILHAFDGGGTGPAAPSGPSPPREPRSDEQGAAAAASPRDSPRAQAYQPVPPAQRHLRHRGGEPRKPDLLAAGMPSGRHDV